MSTLAENLTDGGELVPFLRLRHVDGAQDAERHADQDRQHHNDRRPLDGVSESSSLLHGDGGKLCKQRKGELLASPPEEHPDHGEQRDERHEGHAGHHPG